jgi:hypothetical protein
MTEKRVVFVGHGKPCNEIANCVLSCVAIVSGGDILPNMARRCFPYASLANIDMLLKNTGFIAGVSNPVFEDQIKWWDVLINLNTLKITISQQLINQIPEKAKDQDGTQFCEEDGELFHQVQNAIQKRLHENTIRLIMNRYIQSFVELGSRNTKDTIYKINPVWVNRLSGWYETESYQDFSSCGSLISRPHFGDEDLFQLIQNLETPGLFRIGEVVKTFLRLDSIIQRSNENQMLEILSMLKSNDGSCFPFSFGLFQERFEVQFAAARIILRLFCQKVFGFN